MLWWTAWCGTNNSVQVNFFEINTKMSGSEIDYDSDEKISDSHSKLLEAVAQLDKGQR